MLYRVKKLRCYCGANQDTVRFKPGYSPVQASFSLAEAQVYEQGIIIAWRDCKDVVLQTAFQSADPAFSP
ncbi:hypothetical protein HZ326_28232 [Fusarium oxysporum f. sp. albedinis]|nr:hypothetical protein HZ326_28232 [Fusarium oxysporum f. sp. albedinis]